jgi:acetyl esterase/lipase
MLGVAGMIAFAFAIGCHADSQTTVNIWPGVAPGSQGWTWKEKVFPDTPLGTIVEDVVTPTLTAFLPERSIATGTGIVIAPGGACIALTMEAEGNAVARWFQQRGVAAFVLKYRLMEKTWEGPIPAGLDEDVACKYGIADAVQAVKLVRQHAAEWGIAPHRVGMLGFSAGGMIASETLLQKDAAGRPDFAGLIYGAPFASMPVIPPGKLPPVFMAWAQDDATAGYAMVRFRKALDAVGDQPEVHIYDAGGHGFGMKQQGTGSDHWMDEFCRWLQAKGFVTHLNREHGTS